MPRPLYVTKANTRSTRGAAPTTSDYVGVRRSMATGRVVGEYVIRGAVLPAGVLTAGC